MAHLPLPGGASQTVVDLRPWQIARTLSPMAVSREELELAREAERLADHEVTQAFAMALRQAAVQPTNLSPEARDLAGKVKHLEQAVKEDAARLHAFAGAGNAAADDDLKLLQAQLDLDTDALNDAQGDLARASGDSRARIQQELAAHQAAMSKMNAQAGGDSEPAVLSTRRYGTLAGRVGAWFNQRTRQRLMEQAEGQARADAARLTAQHNALTAEADRPLGGMAGLPAGRLAELQNRRAQQQLLALYDDRVQAEQQLAGVYQRWAAQVALQHRIVMHLAIESMAFIACLLAAVILGEAGANTMLQRYAFDARRKQTLRTILRLSIQCAGGLGILLIVFGLPSQFSTMLGLVTAGLTVALQSYLLAFIGWFVLMGSNGMRIGDWVQINGVAGEVCEISLCRTTLLETSDWAAKGHPTGRRATFLNSFAIAGQFFNFSTAGQWMWDEISVSIPSAVEGYQKALQLNQAVLEQTQADALTAEGEWRRTARGNSLSNASAAASIQLRPAGTGLEVLIRYVTRAPERVAARDRVYERVLEILHNRMPASVAVPTPQPSQLTASVLAAGEGGRHSIYS